MKRRTGAALLTGLVLGGFMAMAVLLAEALKPTRKLSDTTQHGKLANVLPMQFGDWRSIPVDNVVIADPRLRENLERIYTETISRTYVAADGRQVMLSIAYGNDQRDGMNVHYPEVCYPAQGFQLLAGRKEQLSTPFGRLQVKRLEMTLGQRHELITYWTIIGEHQSLGKLDKKMIELSYGLRGLIPDGLLFRVSSIDANTSAAFDNQDRFIGELLGTLDADTRKRLAGL